MRSRSAVLVIAALALAAVAAAAQEHSPDHMFMMEAAQGGMMEVELGTMAAEKAASADVKQFGQRMVEDHGRANQELMQLASKKNVTLPAELDAHHRQTVDRLAKLSGAEFDRAYMGEMVKDHMKDIQAFEHASKSAQDADVKAWAAKTLPVLREHGKMAQSIAGKVGAKPDM